ncbi:hypothetical protein FOZ62_027548, partial [Perkinsus olseni]
MDERGASRTSMIPQPTGELGVSTRPTTAADSEKMTGDGEHARERMVEQVDEMATDGTVLNLKARFLMHLNTRDFPRALETARELSALDPEDATVKEFQVVIQRWMDLLCMRDDDDDDEEEEESSDHSSNNGDGHAEMDKDCPTSHPDSSHISIFAERLPDVGACETHCMACPAMYAARKGKFYTGLLVNRHIEGRCVKCQSGQYSVGGGKVLTNWVPSKAHPSMKSWCVHSLEFGYGWAIGESWVPYRVNTSTDNNSSSERCMSWVASEDGEVVYSGENYGNPDIDSVLRLQDNWLSDGEARFVYMVDGEDEFDGFRFMVDGVMMLGPEYTTVDDDGNLVWKEGSVSLEAGPHTLEWVYSKDMSEDYGYDRAWIRSIELLGTRTVDLECLPCPPGDQRLLTSTVREQCLFCGRDEYPDHNTSVCQQCPPGQYAAPGDSSCSVRPPCTAEDYSIQYSDCDAATWKRTGRYGWSSPIVCDSQLPESVPLPTETITTACEDCPTGSYLDPQEGRCIRCPAEVGKIATAQGCAACPDGQVPAIELVVNSFPALWSLPFRFRGGSWLARQESLATELTDHLTRSVELTWRVDMLARGVLKVNYSVQAEGETPPVIVVFFGARAAQEPIRLTPFDAARGVTVPSREVTEISIRCEGPVGSKFTFTSFSLSSSRGGGAAECHPCDPGQALVDGSCQE